MSKFKAGDRVVPCKECEDMESFVAWPYYVILVVDESDNTIHLRDDDDDLRWRGFNEFELFQEEVQD